MRAITLWQPWASLIAEGIKTLETRPKRSPWSSAIGETIAIHAAMREPEAMRVGDWSCGKSRGSTAEWALRRTTFGSLTRCMTTQESHPLPLGAVVATCTLTDVVPIVTADQYVAGVPVPCLYEGQATDDAALDAPDVLALARVEFASEIVEGQRPFGDFAVGRWALLLDNIEKLPEPVPARGWQGWWDWQPL